MPPAIASAVRTDGGSVAISVTVLLTATTPPSDASLIGGRAIGVVNVSASGFSINTVGIILMIAGALGLVLSLLFWSSFSPYRRGRTVAGPDTVVEERRIERDLPSSDPGVTDGR